MNSDRQKIAERLKQARTMAGLSQAQAAEQLKLQRPAISEIEAGNRRVSAEELIRFADLYMVNTSWLLLQDERSEENISSQYKLAARELSKLGDDEIKKVLDLLKILPK